MSSADELCNDLREVLLDIAAAEKGVPLFLQPKVRSIVQPIEHKLLVLLAKMERASHGNQT